VPGSRPGAGVLRGGKCFDTCVSVGISTVRCQSDTSRSNVQAPYRSFESRQEEPRTEDTEVTEDFLTTSRSVAAAVENQMIYRLVVFRTRCLFPSFPSVSSVRAFLPSLYLPAFHGQKCRKADASPVFAFQQKESVIARVTYLFDTRTASRSCWPSARLAAIAAE
jgi:hypothetical protein